MLSVWVVRVCVCVCVCHALIFFLYPRPQFPRFLHFSPSPFCFGCQVIGKRREAQNEVQEERKMECGKEKEGLSDRKEKKETERETE